MHTYIQPKHKRLLFAGPLVLGKPSLSFMYNIYVHLHICIVCALTKDMDRPPSQGSKPNSRTAFIGEQPNPWGLLQSQDAMSRHRDGKPLRRYELLGAITLLSPGYLIPLCAKLSTQNLRITKTDFRPCSICTILQWGKLIPLRLVLQQPWAYLRAPPLLFSRRPPQSNCQPTSVPLPFGSMVRAWWSQRWYCKHEVSPTYPTYEYHMLTSRIQ